MSIANLTISKCRLFTRRELETSHLPMGNCPKVTMTPTTETLEHFSSQEGIKVKDAKVLTSQSWELDLETDNVNAENIALAIFGSVAPQVSGDPGFVTGASTQLEKLLPNQDFDQIRSVIIIGTNAIGRRVAIKIYRASFNSGSAFEMVSEEFNKLSLKAECLLDETKGVPFAMWFIPNSKTVEQVLSDLNDA